MNVKRYFEEQINEFTTLNEQLKADNMQLLLRTREHDEKFLLLRSKSKRLLELAAQDTDTDAEQPQSTDVS